ncbi:MAG: response regulator transcription factor [Candidatus Rokuibacteriota bacterium]
MARLSGADQGELRAVKRLCYQGLDSASLREMVGERLRRHLEADAFAFLALEPASGLPVHAVHDWPAGMCDAAHERALLASPAADFGRRPRLPRRAHRVEELVSTRDGVADLYLAEVLRPFGYTHEIQVSCTGSSRVWGNLHLTRREGREAFPAHALSLLEALAPHLTAGLRAAAGRATLGASPGSGVGMVLLGPGGGIELANDVALQLLRATAVGQRQSRWVAIQTVAGLLGRVLDGDASFVPTLDVVDPERGEVYRLRAERLRHADGRARDLVLIEPGRLSDGEHVLPALGLTAREGEVAMAVLRGLTTKEIAAAIRLSPHTVQTHVRHIFDKVGVDSRRALASVLNGLRDGAGPATPSRS